MNESALLDAARRFVAEHPYSLKRAPETFAGELAAWASSMVEAEVQKEREVWIDAVTDYYGMGCDGVIEAILDKAKSLRPTPSKGERP